MIFSEFFLKKHPRILLVKQDPTEENVRMMLRRWLWISTQNDNALGEIIGRTFGKSERKLINAVLEKVSADRQALDRLFGDEKNAEKKLKFKDMEIDLVTYVDRNFFDLSRALPQMEGGSVTILAPDMDAQNDQLPRFNESEIRKISSHSHVVSKEYNSGEKVFENEDYRKMSQLDIVLPTTPDTGHQRIIVEICGIVSIPMIREKLWQLEKDIWYFVARDFWRKRKADIADSELDPFALEQHTAFVALAFPYDGYAVEIVRRMILENKLAFKGLYYLMNRQKLLYIVVKSAQEQIGEIRVDIAEIRLRLDRIELRLDRVEQRLDRVEQRLDRIELRLDRVEQRLDLEPPQQP